MRDRLIFSLALVLGLGSPACADPQYIARGTPNGGMGDSPYVFSGKINANTADLYAQVAALRAALAAQSAMVPSRAITGSGTVATTPTDYLVVVKGPTIVTLETTPPNGTTHVIKLGSGTSLTITPGGSDTIDGAASVAFTNAFQAATFTYTTGAGWSVY